MFKKYTAIFLSFALLLTSVFGVNTFASTEISEEDSSGVVLTYDSSSSNSAIDVKPAIEQVNCSVTPSDGVTNGVVVLDVSSSMKTDDRFIRAKSYAENYAKEILQRNNSKVALVVFGDYAEVACGFTNDYQLFEDTVESQGTQLLTDMKVGFVDAKELLDSNGINNKNSEVYFITDGIPVQGEMADTLDMFSIWEDKFSSMAHYAEATYEYVKNNFHNTTFVKTQGVYTGMPSDKLSFAQYFLKAIANPYTNTNVDADIEFTTVALPDETTTEETTETTTKRSGGGNSSSKADVGAAGNTTEKSTETDEGAIVSDDTYTYGTFKDYPTLKSYKVNSVETAKSAVESTINAIKENGSQSFDDREVKNQLALFAEEASGLVGADYVTTNEINIDVDKVKSLGTKSNDAIKAMKSVIEDSGIDVERELRSDVTINTTSTDSLTINFNSSDDFANVDYINVESPLGKISFNKSALTDKQDVKISVEYTDIDGTNNENGVTDASSKNTAFKITSNEEITDGMYISIKPQDGENIDNLTIVDSNGNIVLNKFDYVNQEMCAMINSGETYYIDKIVNDEVENASYESRLESVGITPLKSKANFKDIVNLVNSQKQVVEYLYKSGVLSGQSETQFGPDDILSRAEFTILLLRSTGQYNAKQKGNGGFSDVSGWAAPAVAKAKQLGIISGYKDGTFKPDNNVSKEQVYQILGQNYTTTKMGISISSSEVTKQLEKFVDKDSIANWAKNNIGLCSKRGIVTKNSDNTLKPKSSLKRIDAAVIIKNFFDDLPFKSKR